MSRLTAFLASTLLAVPTVLASFPDCQTGPAILRNNSVCDTSKAPEVRAAAIIKAMTLQEKLNNTGNTAPGVPRLGLPPYQWWQEALHGVARSPGVRFATSGKFSYATSFPEPILMGAAFDDALIEAVATVVSTEARAFNNVNRTGLDFWTPNINGYKDPRWGRGMETPGEDPFHLSSYVKHLLLGLQGGEDPKVKKIIATCKHYAAYDLEDWGGNNRMRFDAKVSTQDLVEYYLPMFQQCARDSNVGSIMCSYNAVNGVPSCADPYLLQTILREHWGWTNEQQYITSDCDAIKNVAPPWHNYTKTPEEAVAVSLNAGTDLDCGTFYPQYLPGAYQQGLFNESTLDQALIRQYSALVRLGYFDPSSASPYRSLGWGDVATPQAAQLAYSAAAEGIVLLKNDGFLPLKLNSSSTNITSVAVVGDWANATTQMQGNYYGIAPFLHSPYQAAQQTGLKVFYADGPSQKNTSNDWPALTNAAMRADMIVYFGGVDIETEAEGMDRNNISWTSQQLSVLKQLSAMNKPLVVVQLGDQLDSSPLLEDKNVNAILWGGYPGQSGGDALWDVIIGKTAPAGRLPVTQYPGDYVSQVPMTDMSLRPSAANPGRTYKWYNESVLPFGHGLHYTNFSATFGAGVGKNVSINSLTDGCNEMYKDRCSFVDVPIRVENKGPTTSDFVALLFISGEHGPKPYPIKELVGYTRIKNVKGKSVQEAKIPLSLSSLSRVDSNGNRVVYPGKYNLLLDVPTASKQGFTLTGESKVLDEWPENPYTSD